LLRWQRRRTLPKRKGSALRKSSARSSAYRKLGRAESINRPKSMSMLRMDRKIAGCESRLWAENFARRETRICSALRWCLRHGSSQERWLQRHAGFCLLRNRRIHPFTVR
jgi:hypothetical protein